MHFVSSIQDVVSVLFFLVRLDSDRLVPPVTQNHSETISLAVWLLFRLLAAHMTPVLKWWKVFFILSFPFMKNNSTVLKARQVVRSLQGVYIYLFIYKLRLLSIFFLLLRHLISLLLGKINICHKDKQFKCSNDDPKCNKCTKTLILNTVTENIYRKIPNVQ